LFKILYISLLEQEGYTSMMSGTEHHTIGSFIVTDGHCSCNLSGLTFMSFVWYN